MSDLIDSLSRNLRGYWCPMLQYGGLTLRDQTRFKNNGTLTNMDTATDWVMSRVRGRSGRVLDFDGTNDYIPLSRSVFNGLAVVTVAIWGRPRNTTSRVEITEGANTTTRSTYGFAEDGNAYIVPNSVLAYAFANWSSFGAANFLHGVFIFNSFGANNAERGRIWINGLQSSVSFVGTLPSTAISVSGSCLIGARPGPSSYSDGQVAEVAVWNRALNPGEIQELYRIGPGWYQPQLPRRIPYSEQQAGFKAYWHRRQSQLIGGGV